MLNDFPMMVLAIVASQGGIALLLVVMSRLEPGSTSTAASVPVPRRRTTPRPTSAHATASPPGGPALQGGHGP